MICSILKIMQDASLAILAINIKTKEWLAGVYRNIIFSQTQSQWRLKMVIVSFTFIAWRRSLQSGRQKQFTASTNFFYPSKLKNLENNLVESPKKKKKDLMSPTIVSQCKKTVMKGMKTLNHNYSSDTCL